jgi:hypothetical protein
MFVFIYYFDFLTCGYMLSITSTLSYILLNLNLVAAAIEVTNRAGLLC